MLTIDFEYRCLFSWAAVILLLQGLVPTMAQADGDLRRFQHGIDFVPRHNGTYWLIWSSSGNPLLGEEPRTEHWTHDIYYSAINPASPQINPVRIISKGEAQEPASSAVTADGHIMITMEDGWKTAHEVAQRYGVYDDRFQAVAAYPRLIFDGGHSGHVAAVGNRFVVFWSEGWVDGGGVSNLGSGDDVYATVLDSNGNLEKEKLPVAAGRPTRDWWPLVAGSRTRATLVWQRFVNGETYSDLLVAVLDPDSGIFVRRPFKLSDFVKYYHYSVAYVPAIDCFLILGTTQNGKGFGYLLDMDGTVVASNKSLPGIVRESQSVVFGPKVVQAKRPSGIMVLRLTASSIVLEQTVADNYDWEDLGTDGIFTDPKTVYMVALSEKGLVEKTFALEETR